MEKLVKQGQTNQFQKIFEASTLTIIILRRNFENLNYQTMDSDKRSPSIESNLEAPYVGDTRTFSDFIMYVVNAGRFQHNNLLDSGRRKGVLSLVQAERVVKLTLDRRLSPIHVSFTPGGRRQLVYLVSLVRAGKPIK